jgi:hypothetical protein
MKAKIEVRDKQEAAAIERAMSKDTVRAFVLIVGVLETLPSDRARERVLNYVKDMLDEQSTTELLGGTNEQAASDGGANSA